MSTNETIITVMTLLLITTAGVARADTLSVGSGPGYDFNAIQAAINAAVPGDCVIVSPGTYYENINFNGKSIIVTSTDPNDPAIVASTIIDAGGSGSVVTFANGETSNAILTGFTITGGASSGIYCSASNPTISKCVITANMGSNGGAIYAQDEASPTISNNVIADNSASNKGGAIYYGEYYQIQVTITNNVFNNNSSDSHGGAIYCVGGYGSILDAIIKDNIIRGNSSEGSGGGIYCYWPSGQALITNNIISINTSAGWDGGGGILCHSSDMMLANNMISGNCAYNCGGGISLLFSDVTLINNTIVDNSVASGSNGGGGVYCENTTPVISNCILWGNNYKGDIDESAQIDSGTPVINYSCVQNWTGNFGGTGNNGVDPFFADPNNADYHLQESSPCINAGDPSYSAGPDEVDIDGEPRIMGDWVDMGADEYAENIEPIADAGPDQTYGSTPPLVTLDGSSSFDADDNPLTYHWNQIEGTAVVLSDPCVVDPCFVPVELGVYVFELVVNDGLLDSSPDTVGIVIGNNHAPMADAGLCRYAGIDPVVLDGYGSYDPDGYGEFTYQWQQVSGPAVVITDSDTVTPAISGFTQTSAIQECEFELIVSDSDLTSLPDVVKVIIVPSFGANVLEQSIPFFDSDKPTIVGFGGGSCSNIGEGLNFEAEWREKANWITTSYGPPYEKYGDMLIVYLSSVAPDYKQLIQTMGFSSGNMPAIDVAKYINLTYADARYAVNRVSLVDAACRTYTSSIEEFNNSAVDGEQCWIDNYIATHSQSYSGTLNIRFLPPADHATPVNWYSWSIYSSSWPGGDFYNNGLTGGYYYSVIGPGKNLQLAVAPSPYYFKWVDSNPDYLDFYNESSYPGRLPEPVTLVGPEDGAVVDSNGAVLTCEVSENAMGYQLLFGPDPYHMDYVISDTPAPPTEIVTAFCFDETWWTIKVRDQYGTTIYADPRPITVRNVVYNPIYLGYFTDNWLETGQNMQGDLNSDNVINFIDFAIFAENWLLEE